MGEASVDIDALLGEVAEMPPCGPNLEYDPDFQALEIAARGKPEQVIGDHRTPAVAPDWAAVNGLADRLLRRTKDLRVALMLTRAALSRSGLLGFRDGLALIHGLLDRYWDGVHPQLDPSDPDVAFRMNALAGLVDPETTLREVRHAAVVDVPRKGRVSVADILISTGKLAAATGETPRPYTELEGLLKEATNGHADALAAAGDGYRLLQDVGKLLAQKVGAERAVDLRPLGDLLAPVAAACDKVREVAVGTGTDEEGAAEGTSAAARLAGPIRNREEAIRMLERVCEFMERHEPANPAPLLIRRAQRLMSKSFVEIIEDLSPDSLSAIKALAGIKD